MNILKYIPHVVNLTVLGLAIAYRSPGMAYAAILCVGLIMAKEQVDRHFELRIAKASVPDDLKKKITDTESRLTALEFYIKQRGF